MYDVRCTMYDLRCTIYDVRFTMYDVRCTILGRSYFVDISLYRYFVITLRPYFSLLSITHNITGTPNSGVMVLMGRVVEEGSVHS